MPSKRPGDIVQALMDRGATICRPRSPRCGECPLMSDCAALASGNPQGFPEPRLRSAKQHRYGVCYWTEREGLLWLTRRPPEGLLGGMAALPGAPWNESEPQAQEPIATVRHVFTHFSLDLLVVRRSEPQGEGWWHPLDCLARAGLPTLYRKAVDLVLSRHDRLAA